MDEVATDLLQVFLEVFFDVLVDVGLDVVAQRDGKGRAHGCVLLGLFTLAGATRGAVVNWMHPTPVIPFPRLRVTNPVVGPLLAGGLPLLVTHRRRRDPLLHFWMTFYFAPGYDLARFAYAHA